MKRSISHSGLVRIFAFWSGLLALAFQGRASDAASAKFGPPSAWVKPNFYSRAASETPLDPGADQHLLLLERQVNVPQNEFFFHSMRQILTTVGVQNGSTLKMDFDPGYQSLTLHWVRIWRGTQRLDRLDTNNVKIVRQEKELEDYILNGEESAILVLGDVRPGDIIDYACSIKGENAVFAGHFNSSVPVQMTQPVERLLTRVLWPAQRKLYARAHGCTARPVALPGKEVIEYVWDFKPAPGVVLEDYLPAWCEPEPWVQLSEFKSWAEVNDWALALFQTNAPLSPELSRKIAEWRRLPTREEQVLAALRFVQDDVRYFGIEIGVSSEKPADPSAVFSRRFGDCKDKSLLFVTVLRALGINAYPVLVNSALERGIEDWQPSASAFDHCIAAVQCDGQAYWLDPTINYQRGPLAAHYLPRYGCGLVVAPKTAALARIPQTTAPSQTITTEYFQIRGKTEGAELRVVTVATGRDADRLRAEFASTKRAEIEKNYAHFYYGLYPGIKTTSPIAIEDDEVQNRFQMTESYSMDRIWSAPDKDYISRCEFYPSTISALLRKPVDKERKFPLAITFPQHQILRTEVSLPGAWAYETEQKTVSDPAFTLRKDYRCTGNKIVMEYEYQSLADSVSPDRVAQYLQQVNDCSPLLGHVLRWQ